MSLEQVKQVIGRAVLEPEFRELLLKEPGQAMQGFDLTGEEQSALQQITPEQLDQFAAQIQQQFGGLGSWSKVDGLEVSWDVEGGYPAKGDLSGLDASSVERNPGPPNDSIGRIEPQAGEVAKWNFENAWPSKVSGPVQENSNPFEEYWAADGDAAAQKVSPADAAGQKVSPADVAGQKVSPGGPSFFNGKILSAEDLRADQNAASKGGTDIAMEELQLSNERFDAEGRSQPPTLVLKRGRDNDIGELAKVDPVVHKIPGRLKWNDVTLKRGHTSSDASDPEWKYVPVRRFAWLGQALRWAILTRGGRGFLGAIMTLIFLLLLGALLFFRLDGAQRLCDNGLLPASVCQNVPPLDALQCGDGEIDFGLGEQCDGDLLNGCISGQVCSDTCDCIWVVEPPVSSEPPNIDVQPVDPPASTGGGTSGGSGGASTCGDGVCAVESENSDLCPADCACVDDGVCNPGEGANCLDCGANAGSCGAACTDSAQCAGGLACAGSVCWDACTCGGDCATTGGDTGGTTGGACRCERFCAAYDADGNCVSWEHRDCTGAICTP